MNQLITATIAAVISYGVVLLMKRKKDLYKEEQ